MVDKSLKLYNGSDLLPVNDYTDEDWTDWSQTELAMAADGGDSTASTWQLRDEGGVIPDRSGDYGSYFLEAHNVVRLKVGSNTLFRGRLGYDDRKQGRQPSAGVDTHSNKGRAVEFTVTLADVNDDLRGIIVHAWSRPEETDVARVQALVAAYLSGNPRPSTNLNGSNFVVTGSNTFTVPAKTYYGVTPGEVLQEIAELTDKQMFVDVDENLHYHGNDYGWNAPIRISDDPADLNAITCVPIDASRAEESRDTLTALRAYWGNNTSGEQNTFQRTDTTKMAVNDYWEDVFFDSESTTWAEASNRASNYFVPRKLDQTSYTVTIGKPGSPNGEPWTSAEIALAPKAGQLIDFKALKARGGRTDNHTWIGDFFLNRRIKEVRWTFPTADGFYCQLTLDRPRHSLLGGTPFHKPSPPDTGTPGTPPTSPTTDYYWTFTDRGGTASANLLDDGTSDFYWFSPNWETGIGTSAWHADYDAHMSWGNSGAVTQAVDPLVTGIPVTAGTLYTFTTDMSQRQSDSNAWMRVEWYNAAGLQLEIDYIAGPGVSVAAKASYSKVVTAPATATFIRLRVDAATGEFGAADNIYIKHGGTSGTAGTPSTSGIPGTVGGTGSGAPSSSGIYIPYGSVLELTYIDSGGPYIYAGGISYDFSESGITADNVQDAIDYLASVVVPTGGYLTPTGGEGHTVATHTGISGAETIDLADGNVHDVSVVGNWTPTLTGFTAGKWCEGSVILHQDSTGGRTTTLSSYETPSGFSLPTDADSTSGFGFGSLDGGTTVYIWAQGSGSSVTEIADLPTAETDTSLVLHPDGAGGIAWGTDATASGSGVTTSENRISGDVSMTSANTFYDGPSLSLSAGTYVLVGKVTVNNGASGGARVTAKLWNGTTVEDSAEAGLGSTVMGTLAMVGVVTVAAGSETWKISAATNTVTGGASTIFAAANANGAGNNASTLIAMKIA